MQGKLHFAAFFLCFGLINFSHANQSEQIAFVLLRLVDNAIRMEKYKAQELDSNITKVTQEKGEKHLIMTLDLADNNKATTSMEWDPQADGLINITTKNTAYTLPLEALFKDTQEEVIAVCFDCKIEYKEEKSYIDIILPIKVEDAKIAFLFDGKTKAACGFFMTENDFEKLIKISGKLTTKDALDSGLIVPSCHKKKITKSTEIDNQKKEEQTEETTGKVTFLSKLQNSFFYIKNFIITKIIAIKNSLQNTLGFNKK